MESRREFVMLARAGEISVAELCRRFGISRQTGHRYLRRYGVQGDAGLEDVSRRPLTSPHRCELEIEARVVALRGEHPAWGERKLAQRLRDLGVAEVPAP